MKVYSNDAITKTDVDAINVAQTEAIKGLKFWVGLLATGVALNLAITIGYIVYSTVR